MNTKLFLFCSLFYFLTTGCEDIFLKDISDEQISIISPASNILYDGNNIIFEWEWMDGAEKYHIEIASPSFDSGSTIYNTITDTTKVVLSLSEGEYQWSVYGYNSFYKSKKTIHSFDIKKNEK